MSRPQQIRRSQFIFTYGPGTVIEGENGARLVPSIDNGLGTYFSDDMLEKFEIEDARMSNILEIEDEINKPRMFTLPSNAALKKSEFSYIYNTYIFPMWKVCYNKIHKDPILFRGSNCPVCKNEDAPNLRFIAACPEGHLDEVNWNIAVHKGKECNSNYFIWKAGGSSLADIIIECPDPSCNSKTNMEEVYRTNFPCSGRIPENESSDVYYKSPKRNWSCRGKMKVIQRQSTALRLPETFTLLTIPQYDSSIIHNLQRSNVKGVIKLSLKLSNDSREFINNIKSGGIPENTIRIIDSFIKQNGFNVFKQITSDLYEKKISISSLMDEEYQSLKGKSRCTSNFKKRKPKDYDFPGYDGLKIKVYPVDVLRTVTVQLGYRRMPYMKKDGESKLVNSGVRSSDYMWYPGFEGIGEGIFISSLDNPLEFIDSQAINEWKAFKKNEINEKWHGNQISWREGMVMDPQFVWWHTISHSIIRALSLISGYSSASLRERVYINRGLNNGGILIYTSSAGEDGGMGGLVETAFRFEEILEPALESIKLCSNDPLCSNMRIIENTVNGSACHNCLMVSETSCEHGNRWLDRHLVIGD
jgi:hypothetical protein